MSNFELFFNAFKRTFSNIWYILYLQMIVCLIDNNIFRLYDWKVSKESGITNM